MKLTENNLNEWKEQLSQLVGDEFGENYINTLSDEEWMNVWYGSTPEEVIEHERHYLSEN